MYLTLQASSFSSKPNRTRLVSIGAMLSAAFAGLAHTCLWLKSPHRLTLFSGGSCFVSSTWQVPSVVACWHTAFYLRECFTHFHIFCKSEFKHIFNNKIPLKGLPIPTSLLYSVVWILCYLARCCCEVAVARYLYGMPDLIYLKLSGFCCSHL